MLIYVAIAAGLAAVYMFIVTMRPLVDQTVVTADDWQRLEDESLDILLHRDRIIEELRDLEFEAAMSKVEKRDLDALKRRYEAEALRLMGEIESHVGAYDARIDADVKEVLDRARSRRAQRAAKKAVDKLAQNADSAGPQTATDETENANAPAKAAGPQVDAHQSAAEGTEEKNGGASERQATPAVTVESGSADAEPKATAGLESTEPESRETAGSAPVQASTDKGTDEDTIVAVRVSFDWLRAHPCEQCATVIEVNSAFCDGCGATVVRACRSCGQDNRLAARFCRACGESVSEGGSQ